VAKKKEPARKGRPPVEINPDQLAIFGSWHCTQEEIAGFYNCDRRTIINRLKDPEYLLAYENGKLKGKLNLKRNSWRLAQGHGSSAVNMTIYLRRQWLHETDGTQNQQLTMIQNNNTLALSHASESDLRALESILARIADASAGQGRVIEAGDRSAAPAG
jgi:hypothetical protein